MIVSYDPIAQEFIIHPEGGAPEVSLHLDRLVVRYLGQHLVLSAFMFADEIRLHCSGIEHDHAQPSFIRVAEGQWRIPT